MASFGMVGYVLSSCRAFRATPMPVTRRTSQDCLAAALAITLLKAVREELRKMKKLLAKKSSGGDERG